MITRFLLPALVESYKFESTDEWLKYLSGPELNIKVVEHGGLFLLKYDQIGTPKTPITNCYRSLVLDKETREIVAFSFNRFFNYGEKEADTINFCSGAVTAVEKLDGTKITVYNYKGKWRMHTSSMLAPTPGQDPLFFDYVPKLLDFSVFEKVNPNLCFTFEYVGPYNQIVTYYPEETLYLINVVEKGTQDDVREATPDELTLVYNTLFFTEKNVRLPKMFYVESMEEVFDLVKQLSPTEEGFVVVDQDGNRVKVKNPTWFTLAHTVNAGNIRGERNYARIALNDEFDEIVTYFPHIKEKAEPYRQFILKIEKEALWYWEKYKNIEDVKKFVNNTKDAVLFHWLIQTKKGKCNKTPRQFVREDMQIDNFLYNFQQHS